MFKVTLDSDVLTSTEISYSLYQAPAAGSGRMLGDRVVTVESASPTMAIGGDGNVTLTITTVPNVSLVTNDQYILILQGTKDNRRWGTGRMSVIWQPASAPPPPTPTPTPVPPPAAVWKDLAGTGGTPNVFALSEIWTPTNTQFQFDYYLSGPTMAMNNSYQTWADPAAYVVHVESVQHGVYRGIFHTNNLPVGAYDYALVARNDIGQTRFPFKVYVGDYTRASDTTNPRPTPTPTPTPAPTPTPPAPTPTPPAPTPTPPAPTPEPPSAPPPVSGSFTPSNPPGSGWTRVLESTDPPFLIPRRFLGWHRDHSSAMNGEAPKYPFSYARMLDWTDTSGVPTAYWAWIQRTQGTNDWSGLDKFIADNTGRFCPYTIFLTPRWLSSNTSAYPSPYGMEELRWGAHPPRDWNKYREFCQALKDRYPPSIIPAIEIWNEPDTWDSSGNNPSKRNTETATAFYRGNMLEMVTLHRIAKEVFTDRPIWSGGWNSRLQVQLFLKTSDGQGGLGADHFDWLAFHSYMYSWNPTAAWVEAAAYRSILQTAAGQLGRPALANKPMINTEIGHEGGNDADAKPRALIARNLRRVCGLTAAAAKMHGMMGIICYADKRTNSWTFWAPINTEPMLAAAIDCGRLEGMLARQIYVKPNGVGTDDATTPIVWIRADNNTEFVA